MTDPTTMQAPLVRRPASGTRAQFRRRPVQASGAPGASESLAGKPAPKTEHVTNRRREIAGDLPEWEPLPPGELTFRRK